jgi:Leucine-rich repeat (LRR) protein
MTSELPMRRLLVVCLLCLMTVAPLYAQDDDPYAIALQRIEEARETSAIELDLSNLGLVEIPPQIGQLSNMHTLNVSYNGIRILPPEIGQLGNLQVLNLSFNHLTILPPEIGNLLNLQILSVDTNQLTSLPPDIGQLSNLEEMNLTDNLLRDLPPEVGRLRSLRLLWLNGNLLTTLPKEIGQLSRLQVLYLPLNQLTTLPKEIGQLSNLCFLSLEYNDLRHLPTTLGNLGLLVGTKDCAGRYYPNLFLTENPLISPPLEVVEQGTAAVLEYLRNQAWYHTQRLILGAASGVGLLVLLVLGVRWKQQRGGRKPKQKRGI